MTTASTLSPEQIIDAVRRERGVTKVHLARLVGMDENNFINALNNKHGRHLTSERRAVVARFLGIPEAVITSWTHGRAA